MSRSINNLYVFNDFTLDTGEGVLRRDGRPISITPKALHLLTVLVEHHGSIVEKEKLISEIWADAIVEDGNLAFTAQLLRKALGDDAKTPIYIETVPRKGYRFIAEVSDSCSTDRIDSISSTGEPSSLNGRRILLRVGVAVVMVSLLTVGWLFLGRNEILTRSAPILTEPFKAERLSSTGNAVQTVISPNGKLIAYTDRTGNGKWSVWLKQLSTAENIQILPPAELMYGGLAFSRDNNSLFLSRGDKRLDIYRVNVFGGVPTKLIENTQGWLSVSPDDKNISFVRCEYSNDNYCSLYIADIDGRNERRLLTRPAPIRIGDNAFSTDGRSVAFAAGQSRTGSDDFELFQVDIATGTERLITTEKFFNIKTIAWLPSGDELLFTARRNAQLKFSIWKASIATGASVQLTRDDGNFSELSLDTEARYLVVTKVDSDFAINLEDIERPGERRAIAPAWNFSFAPDGRIVFESSDRDIWIIDPDGNNKRQLTNDPSLDIRPLITQDGSQIVFSSNRSGVNQVWRMNIDGSDQRQLTQSDGGLADFVSRDGRVAYFTADFSRIIKKIDVESGSISDLPRIDGVLHEFSPDGNLAASFVQDANNRGALQIRICEVETAREVKLIAVGDFSTEPIQLQWSPDGKSASYVIKKAGKYEVWQYQIENGRISLIANLGSEPFEKINLSPDGKSIATIRGSWLHDAFLGTGLKF